MYPGQEECRTAEEERLEKRALFPEHHINDKKESELREKMRPCVVVREGKEPCDSGDADDYQRVDLALVVFESYSCDRIVECSSYADNADKAEELISDTYDVVPADLVRPPVKAFVPAVDLNGDESSA